MSSADYFVGPCFSPFYRCVGQGTTWRTRVYPCRYPTWDVPRFAETMGTRWFMGWLDRQFGILLLSSYDRVGEVQLEERRR